MIDHSSYEIHVPAHDFFSRSIKDLKINGLEYLERMNKAWSDLAENTKGAWSQTIFNKDPWEAQWNKTVEAWKNFAPSLKKEWEELKDITSDALSADSYLNVKTTDAIRSSTSNDYAQIMSLIGNAHQVDAMIAAKDTKTNTAAIPAMSPRVIEEQKKPEEVKIDTEEISTMSSKEMDDLELAEDSKINTSKIPDMDRDEMKRLEKNEGDLDGIWSYVPPTLTQDGRQDGIQDSMEGIEDPSEAKERKESIESPDKMSLGGQTIGHHTGDRYIPLPGYTDKEWSNVEKRSLTLDKKQFVNYSVETFKFGKLEEPQSFNDVYFNKRSVAVEWMLNSGLDFLSNIWDVSIICTRNQGDTVVRWDDLFTQFYNNEVVFGSTKLPKFMGDAAGFMVRCEGIDVPQPKSQEYSVEFLWTTVKKVRSKVDLQRKSTLQVLLDEPIYFLEIFNLLSNNNDFTNTITVRPLLNVPFTTNPLWRDDLRDKKVQINIVVKHAILMRHQVYDELRGNSDKIARNQGGLDPNSLPYWVFEDVNFLGVTTDLEFKRDGPSTTVLEVPFLFKRVFKVDRQSRGGTKTVPALPLQSPRDPLDATVPSMSNTQNDQVWYYGPRSA